MRTDCTHTLRSIFGAPITGVCGILLLCGGCQRVSQTLEPHLNPTLQEAYVSSLPSAFAPCSVAALEAEMRIGNGFAHELDLYRAITSFKRAQFLCPPQESALLMQIQYDIILCYYLGQKEDEVIATFESSELKNAPATFPAFHDLLLVLYDIYTRQARTLPAQKIAQIIEYTAPEEASRLQLGHSLNTADFTSLATSDHPGVEALLAAYNARKKHIPTAQTLNALLPGAGYLYLGQHQSALTAFFLNGLFIAASAYFFNTGNVAAGAIFTSFEAGWYFGGIYGAGLEAKIYNERLYESLATPFMNQERLFPALMLHYAF